MSKKNEKSAKKKKSSLLSFMGGAVLFVAYAMVYPKVVEHIGYLISDLSTKRH